MATFQGQHIPSRRTPVGLETLTILRGEKSGYERNEVKYRPTPVRRSTPICGTRRKMVEETTISNVPYIYTSLVTL